MTDVLQRTSIRGNYGKENADAPGLNDILEALEMMTLPLSSPTDTSGAPTSWTLDEHERFIQGLRMHRDGPYERIAGHIQTKIASEVENYGIQCWKAEKYRQCVASPHTQHADNEVKVETELSLSPREYTRETLAKQHRLRKWFRMTFKWCVEVLSFRCLRHQESVEGGGSDHYPAPRSRPVISTTDPDNSLVIGIPTYSGAFGALMSGPAITGNLQRENRSDASTPDFELMLRNAMIPCRGLGSSNSQHKPRSRMGVRKACGGRKLDKRSMNLSRAIVDEEDDNDDWKMINARRAASEIEWYDTMGDSTASSAPTTTKQVKKRGTWSTDEQDRYCEGVKLFRFGSWKRIADHVGTRTVSQVMSHAQSVRAKKKRCEDREKRYQTRVIPRSCAGSHGSVNQNARKITSQNSTAEDLLIASLLESTHTDAQQSKPTVVITSDDYSGTSMTNNGKTDVHGILHSEKLYPNMILDSDVPLCSPPSDILLSDDDFTDLVDITSVQPQSPVVA